MHYLVRRLTGGAYSEAADSEHQGEKLVLGSSEAATVALPDLDGDVVLRGQKDSSCKLEGRGVSLRINGREAKSTRLSIGGSVSFGSYRLQLITAPAGFDTAIKLEALAAGESLRSEEKLHKSPYSLRRTGWALALIILFTTLALPLAGRLPTTLGDTLRSMPLPDDSIWLSGPLHEAHQRAGIGEECGACHADLFVMVEDSSCISCHGQLREHVDVLQHPAELFTGERCSSCHREHNEPAALLRRDQPLCTGCHAAPLERADSANNALRPVSGFGKTAHPEFRVAHWVPKGPNASLGWELMRSNGPANRLRESSGLKFNHEVHLDSNKVQRQRTGDALACADCHVLKDAGEHFEPISMDTHCRSCHTLGFDSFEPDLELPHGDLRAAIVAMEAHFIREFTDPLLRQERIGQKPRRVPGKRLATQACTGSGLDCGRAEAREEAQYQMLDTGCITCHEVTDTLSEELSDRWLIHPVRLTYDFFAESKFDHLSHMSQASASADVLCEGCHSASASTTSADLLMPARDDCLQCHGEERAPVASDCVTCHGFHRAAGSQVVDHRLK